jgi:hypothetical protein
MRSSFSQAATRAFSVPIESERRLYLFILRVFFTRTGIHPDQVRGRLSLENALCIPPPAMAGGNFPDIQYLDCPINSGRHITARNENIFFVVTAFCEKRRMNQFMNRSSNRYAQAPAAMGRTLFS